MKNRVYKIKDKILVQGNENKLTENEVLVKEENGSVILKERVNGEIKSIAGGSTEIKTKDIQIQKGSETNSDVKISRYYLNSDEHDLESYFLQFLEVDEVYFNYNENLAKLIKVHHGVPSSEGGTEILIFAGPTYFIENGEMSFYRTKPAYIYLSRYLQDGEYSSYYISIGFGNTDF